MKRRDLFAMLPAVAASLFVANSLPDKKEENKELEGALKFIQHNKDLGRKDARYLNPLKPETVNSLVEMGYRYGFKIDTDPFPIDFYGVFWD